MVEVVFFCFFLCILGRLVFFCFFLCILGLGGGMRTSCHDSDVRLLPLHPLGSSVSSQTIVVRIYASWGGVAAASGLHDQHATCCGLECILSTGRGVPGMAEKKDY